MATPPNPPPRRVELSDDEPFAGLLRWVADGRVDAAARERARQRWLEQQADEHATVAGVVGDLAERGRPIGITTRAGFAVRGSVVLVGADFVAVRRHDGDAVVPFFAVATVRAAPGDRPPTGDRSTSLELVFAEALSELAAERPRVVVVMGHDQVRGELRSAGFDVAAVAVGGDEGATVHVAVMSIDHVVVAG